MASAENLWKISELWIMLSHQQSFHKLFSSNLCHFSMGNTHKYLSSRSFVLGENVVSQMYWCIITKNTSFNSTIVEVLETMLLDGYAAMTGLSRPPFLGRPCLDFLSSKHCCQMVHTARQLLWLMRDSQLKLFLKARMATRQQDRVTGWIRLIRKDKNYITQTKLSTPQSFCVCVYISVTSQQVASLQTNKFFQSDVPVYLSYDVGTAVSGTIQKTCEKFETFHAVMSSPIRSYKNHVGKFCEKNTILTRLWRRHVQAEKLPG